MLSHSHYLPLEFFRVATAAPSFMVMLELDSCDRRPRLGLSRQGLPMANSRSPTHPLLSVSRHAEGSNWMNNTKGRLHASMVRFDPHATTFEDRAN